MLDFRHLEKRHTKSSKLCVGPTVVSGVFSGEEVLFKIYASEPDAMCIFLENKAYFKPKEFVENFVFENASTRSGYKL